MKLVVFLATCIAFGFVIAVGCDEDPDGDDVEILECQGECVCDQETATCSCLGGTDCVVDAGVEVTLICEGNARCSLSCGDLCHVECPGTAGCDAVMGVDSTAVCNGTGDCDFFCEGGCSVDCPGASMCTVDCADDATCAITSCGPAPTDCGEGDLACRTDCPE